MKEWNILEWNILELEPTGGNIQNSAAASEAKKSVENVKFRLIGSSTVGNRFQGDMKRLFDDY